jgi:hypothetical protein
MIGRWARALVAVLLAALSALAFAQPVGAQYFVDEHISDYHVDLTIQPSGDLLVKETIQYDFGSSYRHGIFRDVPVRFGYNQQFERVMPLHVESVAWITERRDVLWRLDVVVRPRGGCLGVFLQERYSGRRPSGNAATTGWPTRGESKATLKHDRPGECDGGQRSRNRCINVVQLLALFYITLWK